MKTRRGERPDRLFQRNGFWWPAWREEGIRVRDFVARRYWPTVKATLSRWEQERAQSDH